MRKPMQFWRPGHRQHNNSGADKLLIRWKLRMATPNTHVDRIYLNGCTPFLDLSLWIKITHICYPQCSFSIPTKPGLKSNIVFNRHVSHLVNLCPLGQEEYVNHDGHMLYPTWTIGCRVDNGSLELSCTVDPSATHRSCLRWYVIQQGCEITGFPDFGETQKCGWKPKIWTRKPCEKGMNIDMLYYTVGKLSFRFLSLAHHNLCTK